MWLSKQMAAPPAQEQEEPVFATVTIGGETPAAVCSSEQRGLQVVAPGGYSWRPQVSDKILVLKQMALGAVTQPPVELEPGECCLHAGSAYIRLTGDGKILLHGKVIINGTEL